MCGFAGFTGYIENKQEIICRMMERIVHRGPDMGDFYIENGSEESGGVGGIALGFRRLSILDLRPEAAQPMTSADGESVIVFNGEIYNFNELKLELEALGSSFRTTCDTEVLLEGYRKFGKEIVNKLRGMFAFAIWDRSTQTLFGARDPFGIKPFYYGFTDKRELIFGSEIKSFLEHPDFVMQVNEKALAPYLTFQYPVCEESFFKGVFKLLPGHFFTYTNENGNGKLSIESYYDPQFAPASGDFDSLVSKIDDTVRESVKAHSISDVKVGSFLSGGVDSSYITACLMPDKTFSVGFKREKFDETGYAAELSDKLGITNVRRYITADECFDALSDIQYHMDEPQSNPSSVPLWFLAELAARDVTVVLSGEGADELFAGYEEYGENARAVKYRKLPGFVRRAAAAVSKRLPYFKGHDFIIKNSGRPEDWFIGQAKVFAPDEAADILKASYRNALSVRELTAPVYKRSAARDELSKKQYLDMNLWLPGDILLKADKMCMAHSLELRVPFLDRRVFDTAKILPADFKLSHNTTKYIFRKAANRTLPDEWADREKKGFPVPIRYWFREDKYYNIVKSYFTADFASEFFDTEKLLAILDEHKAHEDRAHDRGRKIYTVFSFLVWYKRFFIDEKVNCKRG